VDQVSRPRRRATVAQRRPRGRRRRDRARRARAAWRAYDETKHHGTVATFPESL